MNDPAWKKADPITYRFLHEERLKMRNEMTESESKLWEKLKSNQLGIKFRRQHMISSFIVDFVALSKMLIVEVDGKIHLKNREYDLNRTSLLNELGFKIIRFSNEEIETQIDLVIEKIKKNI